MALSADGSTALVGAPTALNDQGVAWIFQHTSGGWVQAAELTPAGIDPGSIPTFGWAVALSADGSTAMVSGPSDGGLQLGAIWVFKRTPDGSWSQDGSKINGPPIAPGALTPGVGRAFALDAAGDGALVSQPVSPNTRIWWLSRAGGSWTFTGPVMTSPADDTGDFFGWAVGLDGAATEALITDDTDSGGIGAAWPYKLDGGQWVQDGAKLVPGANTLAFGSSAAISSDGSTAIVGARGNGGASIPSASIYTHTAQGWTLATPLIGQGEFGDDVALASDGSTALVSDPYPTSLTGSSFVFVPAGASGGGGGGSGGGGGGGGGGAPLDLATSIDVSPSQLPPGGTAVLHITVTDVTKVAATHLIVNVSFPAGAVVASTQTDRGPGCSAAGTGRLVCNLDYLSGNPTVGNVIIALTFPQAGAQTVTATAAADQTDIAPANNTATATIQVSTPPPPPIPDPQLHATTRTLAGAMSGRLEIFNGTFTTNEPLRLMLTVTKQGSLTRLPLSKGTRLANTTTKAGTTTARSSVGHRGLFSFHAEIAKLRVHHGSTYLVHLLATNTAGQQTILTLKFRA